MVELRNEKIAVPVVLFAGILWSFGPLVVRYMNDPHMVPWQYIFGRGLTIFIILNLYLYFEEGINFYKNYKKVGKSGLVGGMGLGIAMISFIYSSTHTTAASTLLCLAFKSETSFLSSSLNSAAIFFPSIKIINLEYYWCNVELHTHFYKPNQ